MVMDKKIMRTGLLVLAIQIASAFACWLIFRDVFFIAVLITLLPPFAVFFRKPRQVIK